MQNPLRLIARPMLGSMFVVGGVDALRSPEDKASTADDVAQPIADQVPPLRGADTEDLVRLNGAVQVTGGLLLALGKLPRLASAALAASLVPTTLAAHRFWEMEDEGQRANHQIHFFKNLSMLGGLLLAALDTEGRPGAAWRARHAAQRAGQEARRQADTVGTRVELAKKQLTPDVADAKRLVDAIRG